MTLSAIDAHAHISTTVSAADIRGLGAFVAAVTREEREWHAATQRRDDLAVWGVGVHPGLPEQIAGFDAERFAAAVSSAQLVGEVGLDGRSKAPVANQIKVLQQILEIVAASPRPVTIHSVLATAEIIEQLRRTPITAPILHWWRGTEQETAAAIEMGCFFSLNGAEPKSPKVMSLIPPDRVLTETDFPHTRRSDPKAAQPAAVETIEAALEREWGISRDALRQQMWQNLAVLFDRCDLTDQLPAGVQDAMLTAGLP